MSSDLGGLFALCYAATSIESARQDVYGGSRINDGRDRNFEPNEKKRRRINNNNDNNNNNNNDSNSDDGPKFPVILMAMLTQPRNEEVITFLPDDRSFAIVDPQRLEREVLPLHFDFDESADRCKKKKCGVGCTRHCHSHLSPLNLHQFRALLKIWGFQTVQDQPNGNVYRRANFKRGNWEACIRMKMKLPENDNDAGVQSETTQQDTSEEAVCVPKVRSVTPTDGNNNNSNNSILSSSLSAKQRRQHCSQQQAYHRRIFRENQLLWLQPRLQQQHTGDAARPSLSPSLSSTLNPSYSCLKSTTIVSDNKVETATATAVSAAFEALRWKRNVAEASEVF